MLEGRLTVRDVRNLVLWSSALLVAALVALVPSGTDAGASIARVAESARPNIVVVLTDDMRADELRFLPAVRRLERSGVTFTGAVSADSLCCPARATLLTGKLAHNHLTIGNDPTTYGGYSVFAEHNDIHLRFRHRLPNTSTTGLA